MHCLISHRHVIAPPHPSSPLLFFLLITLLPIFSSFLKSACILAFPLSPLAIAIAPSSDIETP